MNRRAAGAAAAIAALVATLCFTGCATTAGADGAPAPAVSSSTNPLDAGGLQDPRESARPAPTAPPVRVSIPAIGVDSGLERLGLEADGRMQAPVDWNSAGWYANGPIPGAIGPAIIAGHVDSPTAPAVFARLGELAPGAEVVVTLEDGTAETFTVTGSMQSAKAQFPTSSVYSNVPVPALRLITCTGQFDASIGHYDDNLIVFAERAS